MKNVKFMFHSNPHSSKPTELTYTARCSCVNFSLNYEACPHIRFLKCFQETTFINGMIENGYTLAASKENPAGLYRLSFKLIPGEQHGDKK